jgi:hypothetical protein
MIGRSAFALASRPGIHSSRVLPRPASPRTKAARSSPSALRYRSICSAPSSRPRPGTKRPVLPGQQTTPLALTITKSSAQ